MLTALMIPGTFLGIMFIINFAFQGMGKGAQSLILAGSRQGLIYFPLRLILNHFVGLDGVIWAQPVADICCIFIALIMFSSTMKKVNRHENNLTKEI